MGHTIRKEQRIIFNLYFCNSVFMVMNDFYSIVQ